MTKHIKVNSISTAWEVAASIFPTDYQKDEESSKRAGYVMNCILQQEHKQ